RLRDVGQLRLAGEPPRTLGPGFVGHLDGHSVQPATQTRCTDRAGLPGENDKSRLKGVLRVVGVTEHATTDAEHHWPEPADDARERLTVAGRDVPAQQLGIGERIDPLPDTAEAVQSSGNRIGHRLASSWVAR